jgi:Protein of unknown function (DUF3147)
MGELLLRALIGGIVVSAFAQIGDVFKPKRFAGLFGAAPSVALATLGIAIAKNGRDYAATEARSMLGGALAFIVYALCVSWLMLRYRKSAWLVTLACLPLWLVTALGAWWICLR